MSTPCPSLFFETANYDAHTRARPPDRVVLEGSKPDRTMIGATVGNTTMVTWTPTAFPRSLSRLAARRLAQKSASPISEQLTNMVYAQCGNGLVIKLVDEGRSSPHAPNPSDTAPIDHGGQMGKTPQTSRNDSSTREY